MTTKYPSDLDTDTELPSVTDGVTEFSGEAINAVKSAVLAIEQALGTSPQGTAATLTARLASALNDDGTLKAAALVASGLIALPITNSQIGSSAAIAESKLDLDVGTQALQNQIDSSHVDILALQDSLATDIVNLSEHVLGQDDRHDGYQIDIGGLTGHPEINTVEAALDFIYDTFLSHRSAALPSEHNASAITYAPLAGGVIPDTTVQAAIETIDEGFTEDRRQHNDSAHSDGVANDGYYVLGGQAATNDGSLKLTRYQSAAGAQDIIQIGHPNAASIKSKNFQPGAITATASEFNIVTTIGSGITRTLAITGLNTARYPALASIVTLEAVVDSINAQAAALAEHFPVAAFASPDGELVLQHCIARSDCTIKVTAGVQSAISALGFTDIVNVQVAPLSSYQFTVNGSPFSALKTITSGTITLTSTSSLLDLGVNVTSTGLDLFANSLIHIWGHSTASANGTYRIAQISPASPSPNTTIGLATTIAGPATFNFIIYGDTFEFNFAGSPRVLDLFLDAERNPIAVERAEVTFGGLGGVKLLELSRDFPEFSDGYFALTTSGASRSLVLNDGTNDGRATIFDAGFVGQLKVAGPDNRSYATALVINTSPTNGTDVLETFEASSHEARLWLGSAHFDASVTVELPVDRRNVGLVGNTAVGSEFKRDFLERDLADLRSNGFVVGFEVRTSGTTSIIVEGGAAYIAGRRIDKDRRTLLITGVATSAGTYNVVLNKYGVFEIYDQSSTGFSVADILTNRDLLLVCQVVVSAGPVVSSVSDARFFINNFDDKLPIRVEDRDMGSGSFQTIVAAELHAANRAGDSNPSIHIFSTLTETDITVTNGHEILVFGDLTVSDDLILQSNARILVYGSLTVAGTTTIGSNARLFCYGNSTFTNVELDSGAVFGIYATVAVTQITTIGQDSQIIGSRSGSSILDFAGTVTGILISRDNTIVDGVYLLMPDLAATIIQVTATVSGVKILSCYLAQDFTVTESGWSTAARSGVVLTSTSTLSDSLIRDCTFRNFAEAISGGTTLTTFDNVTIDSCNINNCANGILLQHAQNCHIINNLISTIRSYGIKLETAATQTNNIIENNIIEIQSTTAGTSFIGISIGTNCDHLLIRGNLFRDFVGTSAIKILTGAGNPFGIVISENIFNGITTSNSYLLDLQEARSVLNVTNNSVLSLTGNLMIATDCSVVANTFSSDFGTSTIAPLKIIQSLTPPVFADNIVSISTNRALEFSGSAIIDSNYILSQAMTISGINDGDGLMLKNNFISLLGSATTTTSLSIDTSANFGARHIISGNIMKLAETAVGLSLSAGFFLVSENIIVSGSSVPSTLIDITGNSSGHHTIDGNHIKASTGTFFAIAMNGNNASITNNFIDCVSTATACMSFAAGSANIFVLNNFLAGGSGGGLLITHATPNPPNFHVGFNKNYTAAIMQSSLSSLVALGDWTVTANKTLQATGDADLLLNLVGLPVGSQIVSVSLGVQSTVSGVVSGALFRRDVGTITPSSISASPTNATTAYETITITPSSTEYVRSGSDYILFIDKATSGTVDIAQIAVNIKY